MRLRQIRLSNFRNVRFAAVPLDYERVFLLGANGQGKTNLLEAAGLLPALRSFRTQDTSLLIRHSADAAQAGFSLHHESEGDVEIAVTLESKKKTVLVDGSPVRRFPEFIGRFPAVPFCAADIALLRGAPAVRRRWLDMLLSGTDPAYLSALRDYHGALAGRNLLLRQPVPDAAQLLAFEKTMAPCAEVLIAARRGALEDLAAELGIRCDEIGLPGGAAGLAYAPNAAPGSIAGWLELFVRQRPADLLLRTTQRGPHRDDFSFSLSGHSAEDVASEGQQRALVLGLELAALTRLRRLRPVAPVVLADDILGELDPACKAGFWRALGGVCQVIATGTVPPEDASAWEIVRVEAGEYFPKKN
jgi:DNA replication and repair protein RecF